MRTADALLVMMSREIPKAKARVSVHAASDPIAIEVMVAIGCGSIHMNNSVPGFATRRVRQTRRLATQSCRRYRPTACRFGVRVTGQETLCPSNTRPCGPCTSPGASAISSHGAASTVPVTPWESCGSSGPTRMRRSPALLLKLLFTSEPLSIQVHPDDTFARAMGMPNGKSEAWYIISAKPGAQIGVGSEAPDNATGIARVDHERFDRRTGSMASGCERRCHLHSGRHHPRPRRRHRAGRDSAAQRHDIPPVRLRQTA